MGYFSKAKSEECNQKTRSFCSTFGITIRRLAKCYAEVIAHVPQKVATKSSFRGKNTQKKKRFSKYFSKAKREEGNQEHWTVCNNFGIIILFEDTYSLKVGTLFSLKVATKVFLEVKIFLKLRFLEYFSKTYTAGCEQKSCNASDKFGINTIYFTSHHLQVNARVSLKATTAKHLKELKNFENINFQVTFLKQKRRSATRKSKFIW